MKHESTDLRVQRTLKAIHKALFELVLERPYRQISITELTARAGINRKTFYLHYPSLNDLMLEIRDEYVEEILNLLQNASKENDGREVDISLCIQIFYHYLSESDEVHAKLLCDAEYRFFYEEVVKALLSTPFFLKFYGQTDHPELVRAYCAAITSMYRTWREAPGDMTIDDLVHYVDQIMLHGYYSIISTSSSI